VFPIRFRPQRFFSSFFPLFYLSTLTRIDVFADAKCAHTYRKKKTESEEDEHTYTIKKKSSVVVEHDSSLLSTFFLTCAR
jgi:hypothetical protein